jgi:hypothetical protein
MFLTDLTFIEEGNKDYIDNLINFKKRRLIAETILKIMQYQQQGYLFFESVDFIQKKLKNIKILPRETLYECSYYLEPRPGLDSRIHLNIVHIPFLMRHIQKVLTFVLNDWMFVTTHSTAQTKSDPHDQMLFLLHQHYQAAVVAVHYRNFLVTLLFYYITHFT